MKLKSAKTDKIRKEYIWKYRKNLDKGFWTMQLVSALNSDGKPLSEGVHLLSIIHHNIHWYLVKCNHPAQVSTPKFLSNSCTPFSTNYPLFW